MKLKEVPSGIFFHEIERHMSKIVKEQTEALRTSVAVAYRQSEKKKDRINNYFSIDIKKYSEKELLFWILYVWYLPEDLRGLYRMMLEEKIKRKCSIDQRDLFRELLKSKGYILNFLLSSSYFKTSEEFFGWLLFKRNIPEYKYITPRDTKFENNPINHSRIRGYRDKGSLSLEYDFNQEWINDISNQEEEERRKELLKEYHDTALFISGWLE
jgi:hypothetical protein